jgi:hypothetical protein
MALIVDIMEAVVAEMNAAAAAGGFSELFEAVRGYAVQRTLTEFETLRVTVTPRPIEIEVDARDSHQHDYNVDIGVQKRVAPVSNETVDPLMTLMEEIADFWRGQVLDDPEAACIALEQAAPLFLPHLKEMQLFTSVLTLTFRTRRPVEDR